MKLSRFPFLIRDGAIGVALGLLSLGGVLLFGAGPQRAAANPASKNALSQIIDSIPSPATPLTESATPEQVIGLMLHSHTTWQTLQGEAVIQWLNSSSGGFETITQTIELQQFGKTRIESQSELDASSSLWVSDGVSIWDTDHLGVPRQVPIEARSLDTYGPDDIPADLGSVVILHPVASQMPTMLADYMYPLGLAQAWRQQVLKILGMETVAGRNSLKVQIMPLNDDGTKKIYWIDANTGVVLKGQEYSVDQDGVETLMTDIFFSAIVYNAPIPASQFTDPSK